MLCVFLAEEESIIRETLRDTDLWSIIGGTLLTGGVGNVIGTLFGMLSLNTIKRIVFALGFDEAWWSNLTVAAMICLFLVPRSVILLRKNKRKQ